MDTADEKVIAMYSAEVHELRKKNARLEYELDNQRRWVGALTEALALREGQVAGIKTALGDDAVQESAGSRRTREYQRALLDQLLQTEQDGTNIE